MNQKCLKIFIDMNILSYRICTFPCQANCGHYHFTCLEGLSIRPLFRSTIPSIDASLVTTGSHTQHLVSDILGYIKIICLDYMPCMTIAKRLEGKIAVITGGNSGIGLATAQRFVEEGAYVFITGRRQSEVHNAVNQIGKNVTGVQGDVSNLADLDRLYASIKQQKGRIDILFANAGVAEFAPLGSITESHFDKIFNINVKGGYSQYKRRFRCFKMVVPS